MTIKRVFIPSIVAMAVTLAACGLIGFKLSPLPAASAQSNSSQTQRSASGLLPDEQNTVDIVKRYGPSVVAVNVIVSGKRVNPLASIPPQLRPFFRQFMPPDHMQQQQQPVERAAGSGFVIDDEGHILTNFHVIGDALQKGTIKLQPGSSITVRFANSDEEMKVKVVGTNQDYDLALLALEDGSKLPKDAKPIPLTDSSKLQVGEKAIAIGNPFNLQSTVTVGVVSAIQRKQPALVSGVTIPFVQTDAPINPGSSGSPLLNSQGKLIGVNDEILAPNGTFVGVGFAIPANLVKEALPELKKGGVGGVSAKIPNSARIGITAVDVSEYPASIREYLNMPEHGVVVIGVAPGGPAEKAGLQAAQFSLSAGGRNWPAGGDIIIAANDHKLTGVRDLQKVVLEHKAGDTITLKVWHHGETRNVDVTLAKVKSDESSQSGSPESGQSQ